MKTNTFYLLIIFSSSFFAPSLHSQTPAEPLNTSDKELLFMVLKTLSSRPIKIDIHNHNENRNQTDSLIHTATSSSVKDFYNYAKGQIPQAYQAAQDSIIANKTKFIASTLIASYVSLFGYLQYQYYSVYTQNGWVHWSDHLALSELVSANLDSLLEKLIQDVHVHYFNKENVHDVILPHTTFIHEIDHQINAAHNYMYCYQMLKSCYIAPLFGLREATYNQMKEAHTRLLFIKNIFMTWISQQAL
jgi:hypothetical protein